MIYGSFAPHLKNLKRGQRLRVFINNRGEIPTEILEVVDNNEVHAINMRGEQVTAYRRGKS